MKNLLILFFCISSLSVLAQEETIVTSVLRLEQNDVSSPQEKILNPYRKIVIMNYNGREHTFSEYKFLGDSAIASDNQIIALSDIASIKGHVAGETARKVGGGVLMAGGLAFASIAIGAVASGSLSYLAIALPALGVAYLGTKVAGARRFDTRNEWTLSLVPVPQ